MAKQGLFVYKGRGNAADATFVSGECAMVTGSSALYGNVKRNAKFASGISTLPYYPDVPGAPQNTVIGGASLWVMSGKKPEEYKGVAAFFDYLSKPEVAVGQPQAHRLPAGHHPLVRADREERLLQGEPGHRRLGDADDPQDHRQVARHPPRQLRADPHHRRRGDWSRSGAARRRRRKGWTAPSSAATSSSSASRRRTRARHEPKGLTLAIEKRVRFRSWWLPWALIAPQMAIVLVFFFWPAGQALYQSVPEQDAFGTSTEFVGLRELRAALERRDLPGVVLDHGHLLGPGGGERAGDRAAARGDGRPRDPRRDLLQDAADLPYAVAPAVAGVLWLFMFAPSAGIVSYALSRIGIRVEPPAQRQRRDGADRHGRGLEAGLLQLPVLPRRAAVDPEVADRGRGDRRRPALAALLDHRLPAAVAGDLLPAGDQHRLRVLRDLRDRRHRHPGRARARRRRSWSTRSTTTASRRSTSAARRRSRWC